MTVSMSNFHASGTTAAHHVAQAVAEARHAAGYTVDDLSVTTGLVADEIVSIEKGDSADPAQLKRIASALKVPVANFLVA